MASDPQKQQEDPPSHGSGRDDKDGRSGDGDDESSNSRKPASEPAHSHSSALSEKDVEAAPRAAGNHNKSPPSAQDAGKERAAEMTASPDSPGEGEGSGEGKGFMSRIFGHGRGHGHEETQSGPHDESDEPSGPVVSPLDFAAKHAYYRGIWRTTAERADLLRAVDEMSARNRDVDIAHAFCFGVGRYPNQEMQQPTDGEEDSRPRLDKGNLDFRGRGLQGTIRISSRSPEENRAIWFFQIEAFLDTVDVIQTNQTRNSPIKTFMQDPSFAGPERAYLLSQGHVVLDPPEAEDMIVNINKSHRAFFPFGKRNKSSSGRRSDSSRGDDDNKTGCLVYGAFLPLQSNVTRILAGGKHPPAVIVGGNWLMNPRHLRHHPELMTAKEEKIYVATYQKLMRTHHRNDEVFGGMGPIMSGSLLWVMAEHNPKGFRETWKGKVASILSRNKKSPDPEQQQE